MADVALQGRFRLVVSELHLSLAIRLPLAVGLIGPQGNRVPVGLRPSRHPRAPLPAVPDHAFLNDLPTFLAFGLHRVFTKQREHDCLIFNSQYLPTSLVAYLCSLYAFLFKISMFCRNIYPMYQIICFFAHFLNR